MMLDFLGHRDAHDAIMRAIETVLDPAAARPRTPDLGGSAGTADLGRAIADALVTRRRALHRVSGAVKRGLHAAPPESRRRSRNTIARNPA